MLDLRLLKREQQQDQCRGSTGGLQDSQEEHPTFYNRGGAGSWGLFIYMIRQWLSGCGGPHL